MTALELGSNGPDVVRLQEALKGAGYFIGSETGTYGRHTAAAVAYLQSCHSLDIDGVAGPQVFTALGLQPTSGAGHGPALKMVPPHIDVLGGEEYVVSLTADAPVSVRVVVWFRGPAGELYGEDSAEVHPGSTSLARVQIPTDVRGTQGEYHVTTYVFDQQGAMLAEAIRGFRVDTPDRI